MNSESDGIKAVNTSIEQFPNKLKLKEKKSATKFKS